MFRTACFAACGLGFLLTASMMPQNVATGSEVVLKQVAVATTQYAIEGPRRPPFRLTFHSDGDVESLPPDFFGPGSEPFVGTVDLRLAEPALFELQNVPPPGSLPPGGTTTVPVEIRALQLVSIAPIEVTFQSESTFYDVYFDVLQGSQGDWLLDHDHPDGGTVFGGVDSFFDILYRIDFAPAGQSPDGSLFFSNAGQSPLRLFLEDDAPWRLSDSNEFALGSDGTSRSPVTFASAGGGLDLQLIAVPEPSTWLLSAAGGAILLLARQRRSRAS